MLGVFAGAGIGLIGAPLARFFLPGDPATAATATRLFGWAALSAPLVCPTVLLEASLLGAGRSYKFLASMTLANALSLGAATHLYAAEDGAAELMEGLEAASRAGDTIDPMFSRKRLLRKKLKRYGEIRADPTEAVGKEPFT